MFKSDLKAKYPFLTEYFESVLCTDRMPNCILFYGQDIRAQYDFAIEIARLLNCENDGCESCDCYSCKWIEEHRHPAVLTITNRHSKPSDDNTKTVISIKQAQMVKSMLVNTSDCYRVFIFCGANLLDEKNKSNEEVTFDNWTPTGLNYENFKAEAANSLLKIVEESPQNSLFFFLANDKSDIISTIVSRAQNFFVPSLNKVELKTTGAATILDDYPNFNSQNLFEYSQNFQTSLKNSSEIFDRCENYLLAVLKENDDQ